MYVLKHASNLVLVLILLYIDLEIAGAVFSKARVSEALYGAGRNSFFYQIAS